MKKKLLFVVSGAKFFFSHRLALAKAAQKIGYEVHVATPPNEFTDRIVAEGLQHHPIYLDRGGLNPVKDIFSVFSLWRLYRRLRPDIVHHVTVKPILYGSIAARWSKVPAIVNAFTGLGFVFIDQSAKIKFLRRLLARGFKYGFKLKKMCAIFQNTDDRDQFVKAEIIRAENCVLIRGSGVSMSLFAPTKESDEKVLIVLAARMLWDKGILEFVEAASYLKNKNVNARFALIGGIDEANPTAVNEKQLHQWVSEGIIEWWGERHDMPAIMQQAHVVCLPSYREGLPRVLVEAAASARPIVATDTPGCRDVVCHGENGFLVPVKNSEALAEALEALIRSPQLRYEMGLKGRELIEREHALERIIDQTLAVYQDS